MAGIELHNLTKRFGTTTAVDAVELTIHSGELFFLLGPSGCGKTTLLRMIAGFIEPNVGSIRFGGEDVTQLPPNKRNTGMVFQSYALWPHMTVYQNVEYGLKVRGIAYSQRPQQVMKALQSVHMDALAKRKPNELSGGQQQRVALARALVIEPTVLLLDEPLSNLDAKLRLEMRSEIRRICTDIGITAVYVTHDQKEALSMADRVAVMNAGRAVQVGPPRELYDRPASRFVANFLGETNFLPAVVSGTENGAVILETAAGLLHSTAGMQTTPRGGNVTCSLRPESLRRADAADSSNILSGKMLQSIYLGEMAQHLVELTDGTVLKSFELNPGAFREPGEPISLTINPAQVVILPD